MASSSATSRRVSTIEREPSASPAPRAGSRADSKITVPGNTGVKVVRAVTVLKPATELYTFWRRLENLTRVIKHPVTITENSPTESHWIVSAPAGHDPVEWDSLIINDEPDQLIAWRTREGASVANAGTVRFEPAPGGDATEVTVQLEYDSPGGKIGAFFTKLFGEDPARQVDLTLRRFKALMETGEIPTIDGQSVGEPQRSKLEKKS